MIANELKAQIEANEKLMNETKAMSLALESAKAETAKAISERDVAIKGNEELKTVHTEELKKVSDSMALEKAEHAKTRESLEVANKALANPAFAAAAAVGSKKPVAEGAGESADEMKITKENAESKYKKLTDAQARAEFRVKYAVELGLK